MEEQLVEEVLAAVVELQHAGQHAEAVERLTPLVEAHPDNLLLRVKLADARRRAGDLEGATELYRETALMWADRGALSHALALEKLIQGLAPGTPTLTPQIIARYVRLKRAAQRLQDIPFIPLFQDFSPEELDELLRTVDSHEYQAGEAIVREGDEARSLMVVVSGTVRVTTTLGGENLVLATLGPGDFFGERSILAPQTARSAWIEAVTDVEVLVLSRDEVLVVIEKHPNVGVILRRFHERRMLDTLLARMPMWSDLPAQVRASIASEMTLVELPAGQVVFAEGDESLDCFVVAGGEVQATTTNSDAQTITLATLGPGQLVGESAALGRTSQDSPRRSATVRAAGPARLYRIRGEALRQLLAGFPEVMERMQAVFRDRVFNSLARLSESEELAF